MPKFFVCSDIHSFYTPFKKALDEKGFDPNNEDHWLIVCGDCFDRGPDSGLLLKFLMQLERKIIVKGNHDILLEELCMREFPYSYDISNGTMATIQDLGDMGMGYPFDECCQRTWNKTAAYRNLLVNYFETQNYIFVHSWIPTNVIYDETANKPWGQVGKTYTYMEDWRNANDSEWEVAMWGNPFEMAEQGLLPDKKLIFGHFHTSFPRAKYEGGEEFGSEANFDIYYGDGYIAIDGCVAEYNGQINILKIEDEFINGKS